MEEKLSNAMKMVEGPYHKVLLDQSMREIVEVIAELEVELENPYSGKTVEELAPLMIKAHAKKDREALILMYSVFSNGIYEKAATV